MDKQTLITQYFGPDLSAILFALYIPSRGRGGKQIPSSVWQYWIEQTKSLFLDLAGGFTSQMVCGGWKNTQNEIIIEDVVRLYSFIPNQTFLNNISSIKQFVCRLGLGLEQDVIAVECGSAFHLVLCHSQLNKRIA